MRDWLIDHAGSIVLASVITFVVTLLVIPLLVARMRPDYFVSRKAGRKRWTGRRAAARIALLAAKNGLGIVFVLMGVVMLVTPGQGVLTLLIGLSLMDFPGKRRLERRVARVPAVWKSMNWIRAQAHRPPLEEWDGDDS